MSGTQRVRPDAAQALQQLQQRWRIGRRTFNARAAGERRLLIVAAIALAVFLIDAVWLTPAWRAFKAGRQREAQAQAALAQSQELARQVAAQQASQRDRLRTDLQDVRQRLADTSKALSQAEADLVPAREMRGLLESLIGQQSRLRLRAIRTLPPAAGASAATSNDVDLYRHAMEVSVEGDFFELLAWLQSLEALPRKLLWDGMVLRTEESGRPVLTLRVQTLSRDPAPLEIGS